MKKLTALIISLLLVAALCAGCAAASKNSYTTAESAAYDTGSYDAAPMAAEVMEEMAVEAPAEPAAAPAALSDVDYDGLGTDDSTELSSPEYGGRKVIRNVYVSLETDAFDQQMQALLERAAAVGGYVQDSSVNGRKPEVYNDPGRSGYFTFRIPVAKVDAFVADAKGLGTLISCNENAEDITSQYFDMETRLSVLRTQLERLTSILVQTDNLADIIQLESEIARVTLEIEELTTELRRYDGLVDYATVTVDLQELRLSEGPAAEKSVGQRISEDFKDSLYGVGTFFVNFFVWFVGALPVILVIAAIGVGLFFLIRGGKKRRARRAVHRASRMEKKAAELNAKLAASDAAAKKTQMPADAKNTAETEEKKND